MAGSLPLITDLVDDTADPTCPWCAGGGWVCEEHPMQAWPGVCGCGAGMPCACTDAGSEHGAAELVTRRGR